ncbi:hypothetical protein [Providencia sp. PROV273]|uniref:hypothetical protein n=1 Tax=Providencia sp. PROV273 TaxID=2949960 RepID=UPI002349FF73|nr:hypothetical protein [Providencia sp. PROV273]
MKLSQRDPLKQKEFLFKCNEFIKCSERELVYYIHYLQEDDVGRKYISNIDYKNIGDISRKVKNALIAINSLDLIEDMQSYYQEFAYDESQFGWIKNDVRSCFYFLINILIESGDFQYKIENEDYINLNSNSIYYSIIAFFDKTKKIINDYKSDPILDRVGYYAHGNSIQNPAFSWLSKLHDSEEIKYCLNYFKDSMGRWFASGITIEEVKFLIRISDKYTIDKKHLLIALFDHLCESSDAGFFVAENLKMKMASALSSWKNRKNKEGYVDVHFDIKKENIPKLDELKKRFNVMSKKDVVNALIEYMYDKKE